MTDTLMVVVVLVLYASGKCAAFTPYHLSCGTSSNLHGRDGRVWSPDENAAYSPLSSFSSTVAAAAKQVPSGPDCIPCSAARIFNSSFTYTFPVPPGPKFLRLYFYPAVYSAYDASQFYISADANGHSLLRNFSAQLAVNYAPLTLQSHSNTDRYVMKEYYLTVPIGETTLNLTLSPTPPTSHAFVNGIEVVSVPDTLYDVPPTEPPSDPIPITSADALETAYRLNVGGTEVYDNTDGEISGMCRLWKDDSPYLFLFQGIAAVTKQPITYTMQVPNYTAPEQVYQTERHLGLKRDRHGNSNLTWSFKVDPGFFYMVRLHWCEVDYHFNNSGDRIFEVYVNNQMVNNGMDVMARTDNQRDVPVYVDYIVYVTAEDGTAGGSVELWIALHPSTLHTSYNEVLLNGLEIFKISKADGGSLDAPNPPVSLGKGPSQQPVPQKRSHHRLLGIVGGTVAGGVLLVSSLAMACLFIFHAWLRDNEFARQAVAGLNPVTIELLKEFPIVSKMDPAVYGSPLSAITNQVLEEELNGMRVEMAIENKRLFMMDYHDLLLPFVDKINSIEGRKSYASRTIFYLNNSGVLKPIAIELSLPPTDTSPGFKRVYTHGHDATGYWLWKLAKAHVSAVDAGVHQLVNHWLRTHACMEPYIIATHRQLSSMHPIYKLLHPHMRYTMEINALARQSLVNGGGIIEACFTPGRYVMEVSSAAYKSLWRFDMEALPADLLRRGMAVEDPSEPCGIKLLIEDYPYAADGLLVWSAIKEYVESYIAHFYSDPKSVISDIELQEWWREIKNKGHPDKKNEPWWPKLNTKEDLAGIVTIMIWISSGQHAAINFGQYPFGGYVPNRPTLMRKLIPQENEPEYQKFLMNPQLTFLSALPTQLQATKVMAVQETLSTHSPDEDYLGQENPLHRHWISDDQVQNIFKRFSSKVQEIEGIVNERNQDFRNKNRCGAGVPPYELLLPTSEAGVTGRGIPNSISI